MIRVVIVDDHKLLRDGMVALLAMTEGLEVVGEAGSAADAERIIRARKPEVVVLDIGLGNDNGLELADKISAESVPPKIIVVTASAESNLFDRARNNPNIMAYLLKLDAFEKLTDAIRGACNGQRYVSPSIAEAMAWRVEDEGRQEALTGRERQILTMVAVGQSSVQIAHRLKVSRRTVDSHRASIKAKLGLMNAADFARYAIERKLI